MMKKFMILILLAMIFVACDYATDSLALKPDIEITWIDPVAWYTAAGDSTYAVVLNEIDFVAENSLDSYLKDYTIEYYVNDTSLVYTTAPVPVYGKIEGRVNQTCCDTFKLMGVVVPLDPARDHLNANEAARAVLRFVAIDEYFENTDTADVWFGIYMLP
jgi:hypothetical protein